MFLKLFMSISLINKIYFCVALSSGTTKPNIILIIADDLGFNDVGFHGSPQIPTPNIDALAFSGVILNSYYVSPICTPSRSALFTGIHPIHTGLQHDVIYGSTPYGLPLTTKILPEYLKDLGYSTHLVGKWHLGHFRRRYTPTCRGFDSHYGHWTGHKDYYDNMAEESGPPAWGYDMRRNLETTYENFGEYTTDLFSKEAQSIIKNHDINRPLFLTVSHTAVHSANPYQLLQAPKDVIDKYSYIKNIERRKFAAMVQKLDDSVGDLVAALGSKKLLKNSIIIFTTDNGGPAAGFNGNAASNWPLRGVKNTLWEGGVRGAGLIWSPLLNGTSRVFNSLMHIQDWSPTLIRAIGENPDILGEIDGLDLWESLLVNSASPRTELLHNIDDIYGNEGIRVGDWKLLHGTTYKGKWDGWFGPSGRDTESLISAEILAEANSVHSDPETSNVIVTHRRISQSVAAKSINALALGLIPQPEVLGDLQNRAQIKCKKPASKKFISCNLVKGEFCLFNITNDPCEYNNVAAKYPEVVLSLKSRLQYFRNSSVLPINEPKDNRGQPKLWNYTWTNWMDFIEPMNDTNASPTCY